MRIFIKLKHWQLFLLWMFTGIMAVAMSSSALWIFTFGIYAFSVAGWIYAVGKLTNSKNKECKIEGYNEDIWFVLFVISLLPFGYFVHTTESESGFIMFGATILEGISGFKLINFSAKAMSQYEKKRNLKFSEYISEFLLFAFLPLGVWTIQPRMNKLK